MTEKDIEGMTDEEAPRANRFEKLDMATSWRGGGEEEPGCALDVASQGDFALSFNSSAGPRDWSRNSHRLNLTMYQLLSSFSA